MEILDNNPPAWADDLPPGGVWVELPAKISIPNVERWAEGRGISADEARRAFQDYAIGMMVGLQVQAVDDGVTYHGGGFTGSPVSTDPEAFTFRYASDPNYYRWPVIGPLLLKLGAWRYKRRQRARTFWVDRPMETNVPTMRAEMHFRFVASVSDFAESNRVPVEQAQQAFAELMLETKREVLNRMGFKSVHSFTGDQEIIKVGTTVNPMPAT